MKFFLQSTIVFLSLISLLAGTGLAVAAADKSGGSISGNITIDTGGVVSGARVEAFACETMTSIGSALTDVKGNYRIEPLRDGCYFVRTHRAGFESSWHGRHPATQETIPIIIAGRDVTGIDIPLSVSGSIISGQVKDEKGQPLTDTWVTAIRIDEEGYSISDAKSDDKGFYSLEIFPGPCIVYFKQRDYVASVYGGSFRDPTRVTAPDGDVVGPIDAVLARGGRVTGLVTDEKGQGIPGINVRVNLENIPVATRSGLDGRFSLDGLPTGSYRIAFMDPEKRFQFQWYGGTTDRKQATPVSVQIAETTSGIRAVLLAGGGISGWVTDSAGNGVPEISVYARNVDENGVSGMGQTGETGEYIVPGLPTGSYYVEFRTSNRAAAPLYYPNGGNREKVQKVEVTAPDVTYGIDQVMPSESLLHGTVLNPEGEPIPGGALTVYSAESDSDRPVSYAAIKHDGSYSIALVPGAYVVEFRGSGGYLKQWSGGQPDRDSAEVITVSAAGDNELNIVLPPGASISGLVKSRTGEKIVGMTVAATDTVTGKRGGAATSDEDGRYQIQGLLSGRYSLAAASSELSYIREKYPQAIDVTAPEATDNIDFVMTPGGAVEGVVVDPDGNPLPWVDVAAYDPATWREVATDSTDKSGAFWIGGLPDRRYAIRYEKRNYMVQWFKGQSRREDAVLVNIAGASSRSGLDVVLNHGVPLAGVVKDSSGRPLLGAEVEIYGEVEDEPFDDVRTKADGSFTVPNLAPGSYRVRLSHKSCIPQWIGGQDRRHATPVVVGEAESKRLTAVLKTGPGRVSGKLISPEGDDVGQAWMTVIDVASGLAVADERICECSGKFNIPVPQGQYQLRVERFGKVFWYGGKVREEAEMLSVSGEVADLRMVIDATVN